jgi:hypothetical protein
LEDKLDDLVSLLRDQHTARPHAPAAQLAIRPAIAQGATVTDTEETPRDPEARARHEMCFLNSSGNPKPANCFTDLPGLSMMTPAASGPGSTPTGSDYRWTTPLVYDLFPSEAQSLLDFFQTYHLKSFPFFYFAPGTLATDVQHTYPMLWSVMQATCTKSPVRQAVLGIRYKEMLATKVIVEGERSLDLLLSMFVYAAWYVSLK